MATTVRDPAEGRGARLAPIHTPDPDAVAASQRTSFMRYCEAATGRTITDDNSLYRFSVEHYPVFWDLVLRWSKIVFEGSTTPAVTDSDVEHARFFPSVRLSYAENLLRIDSDGHGALPAVTACHSSGRVDRLTRRELRDRVLSFSAALGELGVHQGDRIVAIVSNSAEALVAGLASAAVGATFSSVAPEMGAAAILSRFGQLEPALLLATFDAEPSRSQVSVADRVAEVARGLTSLRAIIALDDGPLPGGLPVAAHRLSDLTTGAAVPIDMPWRRFPFNHPLFILFSSGTTGEPKCIVHGAGGTLVEHVKEHRLHGDLKLGDKLFFHTSAAWMMWNWQLSALACDAEIVVYDGPVGDAETLWKLVAGQRVTVFGTSPPHLQLSADSGYVPRAQLALPRLRAVLSTGSVLHDGLYDWLRESVGPIPLQSISGGTDIIGCFVLGNPNLPVYRGESQCRSLGLDVQVQQPDAGGHSAPVGELVCRNPFPSRPLGLYGDSLGDRFHAAYFAQNPGAWTHGDLIELTSRGTARMHGRSDGVLNVRGIRIGPAEIYRVLESMPQIREAMAVEQRRPSAAGGSRIVLLLVMHEGVTLDDKTRALVRRNLARDASPAHVPSIIVEVPELPATHNGKRSERAARDTLNGDPPQNLEALRNPHCLEAIRRQVERTDEPRAPVAFDAAEPVEDRLTRIWEQVLGVSPIALDDDYFEIGGTSLLTVPLFQAVHDLLGRRLPLSTIISSPTVGSMAVLIREGPIADASPLVMLKEGVSGARPLFIAPGVRGDVLVLRALVSHLSTERPVFGLRSRGLLDGEYPHTCVEDMAEYFVEYITELQPTGPYALAGNSFGGLVAFEIARLLSRAGHTVEFLGLIDTQLPRTCLSRGEQLLQGAALPLWWMRWLSTDPRGKLRRAAHRLRAGRPVRPGALDPAEAPTYFTSLSTTGLRANSAYRPSPYPGSAHFFQAHPDTLVPWDPVPAWSRVVSGGLSTVAIPGVHRTMVREPHAGTLADLLVAHLPPGDDRSRADAGA